MGRKRSKREGNPLVGVAYIRTSTDDQKLSPKAQAKVIERYAREHGVHLLAYMLDLGVCSADDMYSRPGFMCALDTIRSQGAGLLLVAKRDRLGRDAYVTSSIDRALAYEGAQAVSAAGEGNGVAPADVFMRRVIDGAAEYERALIRSRTKAALAVKKERGEKTGGLNPYGFTLANDGKTLVPVPSEQKVIARARALRETGLSYGKIARMLASQGMLSRVGKVFADMQVSRMCGGPEQAVKLAS